MRPQLFFASIPFLCHTVVSFTIGCRRSFQRSLSRQHVSLQMDMESDPIFARTQGEIQQKLVGGHLHFNPIMESPRCTISVDEAASAHGMPWRDTIGTTDKDAPLLYMPFWEWQISCMKESLTNLRAEPCGSMETDYSYIENTEKKARMVSHCYSSDEYRKIRMTYYDAGDSVQVFNSVWYPDASYNLPVLGIDLLAFNRKKYLAIVDFQPLHEDEEDHAASYEHILDPIKSKYNSLKGKMSSKFYDETQFFSQQMLFARFDDDKVVTNDLFPAYCKYVQEHLALVKSVTPDRSSQGTSKVMERQTAYDTYSAQRDPATGLFAAMFGAKWAEDFVHDFLFSMSERSKDWKPVVMGGPPPGQGSRQSHENPAARRTQ